MKLPIIVFSLFFIYSSVMIKEPIQSKEMISHLNSIAPDRNLVFLLSGGTIRGSLIHGTRMINEMRANHRLGILETFVLGQAYIGTGLLTAMIKGNDRISLTIECGGPIKGISVEATASGNIRGYLVNNPIPLSKPLESFDLSPLFGPGFLHITKYLESAKQPFSGQVMLNYGTLAEDLAYYFYTSEQIKTLFDISIQFNRKGDAVGTGGLFIQELPGADQNELERLEDTVRKLPSLGKYFSGGKDNEQLIQTFLKDYSPQSIADTPVSFNCGCTKERFGSFLSAMKQEEKVSILREGPFPLVTTCQNCNTRYSFSREELEELFSN